MMKKHGGIIIGFVCAVVIAIPYFLGFFELAEYQGLDLLFKVRGPKQVSQDIVIVEIDDRAINDFGRWPWPRGYHAEFLDMIEEFEPKAVVFDILFSEKDVEHPDDDMQLAAMTKKLGNVFFASFFDLSSDKVARRKNLRAHKETIPFKMLADNARGFGFVNILVEPDGKVRKIPLFISRDGQLKPSIDLLAASYFMELDPFKLYAPTDGKGFMWINYPGPFNLFKKISFSDIPISIDQLEKGEKPVIDLNILKGKIVLVGLTSTASEDYWSTSFSSLYPGVGIRASSIDTMLRKDYLYRIFVPEVCLIIIAIGLAFGMVLPRRTPMQGLAFFFVIISGVAALAIIDFAFFNIWMDFVSIIILCFIAYPAITLNQFIITRFEKGMIEKELQIASRIQQSILPQGLPQVPGVEVGVKCMPAKHVGGDFYDFIKLFYDFVKLKEDRLGVVIGDVSGKGVPAALFMAKSMADFRGISHNYNETDRALSAINDRLTEEGVSGMFVTMQYLIYKPQERKIEYSNGGHNPLVKVDAMGNACLLTQSVGTPIGIIPGSDFISDEFPVTAGELFLMYTDGISEARDKNGKEFGEDRILESAKKYRDGKAQEIADKIVADVVEFSRGMPQHDDMTVIAIKIL